MTTLTIEISETLDKQVSAIAARSKLSKEELAATALQDFINRQTKNGSSKRSVADVAGHLFGALDLEKQISFCADKEIYELARLQMPPEQDARLSLLLEKQGERELTVAEQKELWELMESNRLMTLKKAFALREMTRRGLNGED